MYCIQAIVDVVPRKYMELFVSFSFIFINLDPFCIDYINSFAFCSNTTCYKMQGNICGSVCVGVSGL